MLSIYHIDPQHTPLNPKNKFKTQKFSENKIQHQKLNY